MTKINNNIKYHQQQKQSQIPRPLNCFLMYRLEKQKEIVAKCPTANHRDISKIIAKWWQEASDEEKEPFRERARIAKQEHNALYPDYKYAPKKKVTPKRVYIRKNKKQQFTSRAKENNMLMEMIYEDPTALKHLSSSNNKTKAFTFTAFEPLSPVSDYSTMSVKTEGEDVYYSASLSASPPMSFASATTPFDSPHVSPYSDYSEFEISSPVSSCETAGCYSPPSTITPFSCDALSYNNSPFSVLDTPFISDSNAYSTDMNYDMGMVDYFHFDHSNTNNNVNTTFKPTTTQEFSWTEPCEALITAEQYRLYDMTQQVYEPSVKYINPALLQLK
ncbi:hypothetical protein V8B55DRAFT_1573548 [Mucor lusitanicus]|uniref:HMG box domain-containing protein n=2 Tax=Mucor circinelloides f. lusitanicus TaxID=29924 RepID=A0A162QMY8_MUCCL|nr:hypothetical protein FB192DRAFT_1455964 [Mucor lusitanicus]OAD04310.1 hypothetical protein MUCCIDRAFT_108135 [Mucor lusitanicus CBS 277.49]